MTQDEALFREFELIQGVIDRQADNSFKVKGWTVTLVVVALVFRTSDVQLFGALIPLLGFWGLDAYFLRQEKKYRKLYDWVRKHSQSSDRDRFDLDASPFADEVKSVPAMMLTKSQSLFYGSILTLVVLYSVIVVSINGGLPLG